MLATYSQRARETHVTATPMQLRECQPVLGVQRLLLDCRRVERCHTRLHVVFVLMHLAVLNRLSKIKMSITIFTPKFYHSLLIIFQSLSCVSTYYSMQYQM